MPGNDSPSWHNSEDSQEETKKTKYNRAQRRALAYRRQASDAVDARWPVRGRPRNFGTFVCFCQIRGKAAQSHLGANAEGRVQATSCDIKATSRPVDSQLIATPKPPQSDHKATLRLPQGSHKAPTKPGDGPRTTDHGPLESECRRKKEECRMRE